jgi:hypothetical protein
VKKKRCNRRLGRGGAGPKNKGSSFERSTARQLSTMLYGEEGYLWRRPGPGTRFFKDHPHRHTGDIVPVADRELPKPFPFHVETKFYARSRMKLDLLLWPERMPVESVWWKAIGERREGLHVMLLLKANRVGTVCVTTRNAADELAKWLGYKTIKDIVYNYAYLYLRKRKSEAVVYVFDWDQVVEAL